MQFFTIYMVFFEKFENVMRRFQYLKERELHKMPRGRNAKKMRSYNRAMAHGNPNRYCLPPTDRPGKPPSHGRPDKPHSHDRPVLRKDPCEVHTVIYKNVEYLVYLYRDISASLIHHKKTIESISSGVTAVKPQLWKSEKTWIPVMSKLGNCVLRMLFIMINKPDLYDRIKNMQ